MRRTHIYYIPVVSQKRKGRIFANELPNNNCNMYNIEADGYNKTIEFQTDSDKRDGVLVEDLLAICIDKLGRGMSKINKDKAIEYIMNAVGSLKPSDELTSAVLVDTIEEPEKPKLSEVRSVNESIIPPKDHNRNK